MSNVDCRLGPTTLIGPRLRYGLVGLVASLGLVLGGCGEGGPKETEQPAVSKSAQDGDVSLKLTLVPPELPFDGLAKLTIEATAPRGVTVEVPDYEQLIRDAGQQYVFRATRTERQEAVLSPDSQLKWKYEYALEFFVPGEFDLPPAKMNYVVPPENPAQSATSPNGAPQDGTSPGPTGAGSGGAGEKAVSLAEVGSAKHLETEGIHVKALTTDEAKQAAAKLTEITTLPPKEMAEPWTRWVWVSAAAAVVATLAVLLIAWRTRRQALQPVIIVPAHEWFDRQLAGLLADDLIAKGWIQEFHYRISDILRGYIERRFHVHAREMTTEEFLTAAGRDNRFGAPATADLNNFLTACDMVKYARHTPGPEQADALVRTAGEFVTRTRERAHERPVPEMAEYAA